VEKVNGAKIDKSSEKTRLSRHPETSLDRKEWGTAQSMENSMPKEAEEVTKGTRPLLAYPGSKRSVAHRIAAVFPPHKKYVEPFAGSASVFFAKPLAQKNVLSDLNPTVIAFYRGVKANGCKSLQTCAIARNPSFEHAKKILGRVKAGKASPCQIMAINRVSNLGKMADVSRVIMGRQLGRPIKPPRHCTAALSMLRKASIKQKDWREVAAKEDSKSTLFFLDPPYRNTRNQRYGLYKTDPFSGVEPETICDFARKARGKVAITYADTPRMRRACKGLHFASLAVQYPSRTINTGHVQKGRELLIANFPIPRKM
jgi:DNA adenine methylase